MIADAVARIQALEQQLTGKTQPQLQVRLSMRACLKELREILGPENPDGRIPGKDHTVSIASRIAS